MGTERGGEAGKTRCVVFVDGFNVDMGFFQSAGKRHFSGDDADGACDGLGTADDFVGGHGKVVAAAGCDVAAVGDDWFFRAEILDCLPEQVAGECAAARGIDMQENAQGIGIFFELAQARNDFGRVDRGGGASRKLHFRHNDHAG